MRMIPFLFLLNIAPFCSLSQSVYGTVSSDAGYLTDFYAREFNDSVLFSYTEYTHAGELRHTKWLNEDGQVTDISLKMRPVAIAAYEEAIYYYYFEEDNKSIKLNAIVQDGRSHVRKESPSLLLPDGFVMAVYEDGNVFFVIYDRDKNRISILEVHGLKMVSEKHYDVPDILAKHVRKPSQVEFFNGSQALINSFKGASKVKLYRYTDLYLVVDSRSGDEKGTHVFRFRNDTQNVEQYYLPIETTDDFVSFLVDNKLFRSVIAQKKFILTVHDFQSGKLLGAKELRKGEEQFESYYRHARAKSVSKQPVKGMMRAAGVGDPSLTVFKDSGKYVILWGLYIDDNGMIGPTGLNPVAGLITMAVATTVLQMMEGPGISQHFYYEYDEEDMSFELPAEDASYVRKKLDDYEIAKDAERVKVKYKSYIPYQNGIIAVYYEHKRKTATLVQFQ